MKLLLYSIYAIILLVICILMYQYGYNMVVGNMLVMGMHAPTDDVVDYHDNQSILAELVKMQKFYLKFTDMVETCDDYYRIKAMLDICIPLFIDFNERMDGYFTNHTEAVETILYR